MVPKIRRKCAKFYSSWSVGCSVCSSKFIDAENCAYFCGEQDDGVINMSIIYFSGRNIRYTRIERFHNSIFLYKKQQSFQSFIVVKAFTSPTASIPL